MSKNLKPFIPSWLDEAGLSQAEFRLYCHLCRRADNETGIAWPSYETIGEACGMSRKTVWRTLIELEGRGMIAKLRKKFGKPSRYRILASIVSSGERLDSSNSVTTGTIEAPIVSSGESLEDSQSFPSRRINRSPSDASIVAPGEREGNPKKDIQLRKSNKREKSPEREPSTEQIQFATWFKSSLPKEQQDHLPKDWLKAWCKIHDKLVRIDKRTPEKIREVCQWARTDSFWSTIFFSPLKLRDRNNQGTFYFDVFDAKMKSPMTSNSSKPAQPLNTGSRRGHEETI